MKTEEGDGVNTFQKRHDDELISVWNSIWSCCFRCEMMMSLMMNMDKLKMKMKMKRWRRNNLKMKESGEVEDSELRRLIKREKKWKWKTAERKRNHRYYHASEGAILAA